MIERSIWLRRAGPGIVALGAVVLLASTTLGARDRPWDPPDCADARGGAASKAPIVRGGIPVAADRAPWFRLDGILDGAGALSGQELVIGQGGGQARRTVALPPESFAAGPFGAVVLVGSDDGAVSRLDALDVLDGCRTPVASSTDVIRRATISPDGTSLVEFRVDRRTRADLGTWRRPLDGSGGATRILPPITPDAAFGRTWSTAFTWSDDGSLAVESCGEVSCRTRVVGPRGPSGLATSEPDLGTTLGLAGDRLVSYLACRGLPCPIVVTELATGRRTTLVDGARVAILTSTTAGPRLVHVRDDGHGPTLHSVALDGSGDLDLGPLPEGFDLLADASRTAAGVAVPADWVVTAAQGRLPADPNSPAPILRHVLDGRSATLGEVLP